MLPQSAPAIEYRPPPWRDGNRDATPERRECRAPSTRSDGVTAAADRTSTIIRNEATERFQAEHGDIWLDGVDNSPYFTGFSIVSVTIDSSTAHVSVTEEWDSGPEQAEYTVQEIGGALLVDHWTSQ